MHIRMDGRRTLKEDIVRQREGRDRAAPAAPFQCHVTVAYSVALEVASKAPTVHYTYTADGSSSPPAAPTAPVPDGTGRKANEFEWYSVSAESPHHLQLQRACRLHSRTRHGRPGGLGLRRKSSSYLRWQPEHTREESDGDARSADSFFVKLACQNLDVTLNAPDQPVHCHRHNGPTSMEPKLQPRGCHSRRSHSTPTILLDLDGNFKELGTEYLRLPLPMTIHSRIDAAGTVVGCWLKVVLATYHPSPPRALTPAQQGSQDHRTSRALNRRRRSPAVRPRVLDNALQHRLQALTTARVRQRSDGVPETYAGEDSRRDTARGRRYALVRQGTNAPLAAYHPTRVRLCPLIPSSAPRIGRRCARRPLVAPSHPRRSSWTAACPAGSSAMIVSAGGTDSLRVYRYQSPMRGVFMLAFVLEPSSPTRSHSPSTRAIGAAYAALCGVETHRARCCDTRKTPAGRPTHVGIDTAVLWNSFYLFTFCSIFVVGILMSLNWKHNEDIIDDDDDDLPGDGDDNSTTLFTFRQLPASTFSLSSL
ncbi:hypothetical protein BJ912DRAFT_1143452, partial [Pholiota molesta]